MASLHPSSSSSINAPSSHRRPHGNQCQRSRGLFSISQRPLLFTFIAVLLVFFFAFAFSSTSSLTTSKTVSRVSHAEREVKTTTAIPQPSHSIRVSILSAQENAKNAKEEGEVLHLSSTLPPPPPHDSPPHPALPEGCLPPACAGVGSAPFGTLLGNHQGVAAYSNCCSERCISDVRHELSEETQKRMMMREKEMFSSSAPHPHRTPPPASTPSIPSFGMQWQCVEYARRYSMLRGGKKREKKESEVHPSSSLSVSKQDIPETLVWSFGDVEGAEDIWFLSHAACHDSDREVSLQKFHNGNSTQPPQLGDLLIYPRAEEFPFGHVAVVVGVEYDQGPHQDHLQEDEEKDWSPSKSRMETVAATATTVVVPGTETKRSSKNKKIGEVFLAEQNWDNKKWEAGNYSRVLPLYSVENQEEGHETSEIKSHASGDGPHASRTPTNKRMKRRFFVEDGNYTILGWVRPFHCYD